MLATLTTDHIIANHNMLMDVKESEEPLMLLTNASNTTVMHQGTMAGVGRVWYNGNAIGNILSHVRLAEVYRIMTDTSTGNSITVHAPFGEAIFKTVD